MTALAGPDLREHQTLGAELSPEVASQWRRAAGPELELLLLCLRWPQREGDRQRIVAAACVKIDWALFLRLAVHHRVVPLVSYTLSSALRRGSLPAANGTVIELRRLAAENTQESLCNLAELRRLLKAFADEGIAVRVLKGLPLAQSVFGDLGLRAAGDIDLLVDASAVAASDRLLRRLDYSGDPQIDRFSAKRMRFFRGHWKDIVYSSDSSGQEVDLHWRCFRNAAMPGSRLCATTQSDSVAFGGLKVPIPPRQETLLYLCVHGTLDGWLYLKSLADVAAEARALDEAALDLLAEAAARYEVLPELTATLLLVRRYLSMDHWSDLLLPASDVTVRQIVEYADRVLVEGKFLATREVIPIGTTLRFEFGLRRSFRYRFELLIRVLFRVRMWRAVPLPDFLFGLYPLLSPIEWVIFRLRS